MDNMRIMICGFGQIGRMLYRHLGRFADCEITAVVDIDPELVGQAAAGIAGLDKQDDLIITGRIEKGAADFALLTTRSAAAEVEATILQLLDAGIGVVTTCEELSYPWRRNPEIAVRLDAAARMRNLAVLGTGINPGFLMDLLPLVLSGATADISHITIWRTQDASPRRPQFQKKIGAGLSPDEFRRRELAGTLRHVGLTESIDLLAAGIGWELADVEETLEAVVAAEEVRIPGAIEVAIGQARGVRQVGSGRLADGTEVIRLEFVAAVGEPESFDRVEISGDPVIRSTISGGLNGDKGTCAIVSSALRRLAGSGLTGFLTMRDLPPAGGVPLRRNA